MYVALICNSELQLFVKLFNACLP